MNIRSFEAKGHLNDFIVIFVFVEVFRTVRCFFNAKVFFVKKEMLNVLASIYQIFGYRKFVGSHTELMLNSISFLRVDDDFLKYDLKI